MNEVNYQWTPPISPNPQIFPSIKLDAISVLYLYIYRRSSGQDYRIVRVGGFIVASLTLFSRKLFVRARSVIVGGEWRSWPSQSRQNFIKYLCKLKKNNRSIVRPLSEPAPISIVSAIAPI